MSRALRPLTTKYYLELDTGSLDNNTADIDRINAALTDTVLAGATVIDKDLVDSNPQQSQNGAQQVANHGGTASPLITWPFEIVSTGSEVFRATGGKITVTLSAESAGSFRVVSIGAGNTTDSHFGIAVDLGTTMVAAELIDLNTGKVLASDGIPNGQIVYGEDLLTRLHFAAQGGLKELNLALIDTVNKLIKNLCEVAGISASRISALSAAGNTSMTHLFLNLNPSTLRQAPFVPVINHVPRLTAKDIGINIAPLSAIYCFPSVGSYLGGDLIAGAIASDIAKNSEISLLLDIGTNGEMILGNSDWLIAGAGAAGPALEGGVAECAGRAVSGAIDFLTIDPASYEPSFHVIGDTTAKHLCGSGLVDTIAQLYRAGLVDSTGRFSLEIKTDRWQRINGRNAYLIQKPRIEENMPAIYITDKDIESFQRTKAAMTAALTVLLDSVGAQLDDISRIYTAGSFGLHVSAESAQTIGLYPRLPIERFTQLGNGSLLGAREALLDSGKTFDAETIANRITYLELSVHPAFMNIFKSAKYF